MFEICLQYQTIHFIKCSIATQNAQVTQEVYDTYVLDKLESIDLIEDKDEKKRQQDIIEFMQDVFSMFDPKNQEPQLQQLPPQQVQQAQQVVPAGQEQLQLSSVNMNSNVIGAGNINVPVISYNVVEAAKEENRQVQIAKSKSIFDMF